MSLLRWPRKSSATKPWVLMAGHPERVDPEQLRRLGELLTPKPVRVPRRELLKVLVVPALLVALVVGVIAAGWVYEFHHTIEPGSGGDGQVVCTPTGFLGAQECQ